MRNACIPAVGLGVCCSVHVTVPLLVAFGPAAIAAPFLDALPVAVGTLLIGALAAAWIGQRFRRDCLRPKPQFMITPLGGRQ
ncbi:MAG: hypothetical protein EPO26_15430 [Chloroflexota bacterium]|nr:MAG: hypothetical protein EPO26_15430 [Chloroflexota bacterium]